MEPRVVNFGSLNIDHVYDVDHLVKPHETLSGEKYQRFAGGKGLNQSVALANAGIKVVHVGKIGQDGLWLKSKLMDQGVETAHISVGSGATGHAMIQVTDSGANGIVLYGGENQNLSKEEVTSVLSLFNENDILLLQNETNCISDIIIAAKEKGMKVFFNIAPMNDRVSAYPLDMVDCFILNEIEGEELTGEEEPEKMLDWVRENYPNADTLLTLGEDGAIYDDGKSRIVTPAIEVDVVDTTAAGDTFIGFFLAGYIKDKDIGLAMELATKAASVTVQKNGASDSIPKIQEILQ